MHYSTVIPTFNRQATLRQTLAAMLPLGGLALWVRLGMEAMLFLGVYVVLTALTSRQIVVEHVRYVSRLARG
jgi:hypothetical protein